jgi:hypothetical protein
MYSLLSCSGGVNIYWYLAVGTADELISGPVCAAHHKLD